MGGGDGQVDGEMGRLMVPKFIQLTEGCLPVTVAKFSASLFQLDR